MDEMIAVAGDMPPGLIRWKLDQKGYTYADVERQYGLTAGSARHAARKAHLPGELAIAEVLGLSPRQIWPSRFNLDTGVRLKPQPLSSYKPRARLRHCLKGDAA